MRFKVKPSPQVARVTLFVGLLVLTLVVLGYMNPMLRASISSPLSGGASATTTYRTMAILDKVTHGQAITDEEWRFLVEGTESPILGLRSMVASRLHRFRNGPRSEESLAILHKLTSDPEPSIRGIAYSQLILHWHANDSDRLVASELADPDLGVRRYAAYHRDYLAARKTGAPAPASVGGWQWVR